MLNDTRPDVLADSHDAYFAMGIDAVEPRPWARTGSTSPTTASTTAWKSSLRRGMEISRERTKRQNKQTDGCARSAAPWVRASSPPASATALTTMISKSGLRSLNEQ
ncbi:hypothetical protein AB0O54_12380 [Pseudarthrobacter oxydans]